MESGGNPPCSTIQNRQQAGQAAYQRWYTLTDDLILIRAPMRCLGFVTLSSSEVGALS